MKNLPRAFVALFVAAALTAFMGLPVCFSSACPMSGAERAACKAMGRDCCQPKGGQVSHAPGVPAPVLATAPTVLALAVPEAPEAAAFAALSQAFAAPAVVQGIGLFTLFAVFLI